MGKALMMGKAVSNTLIPYQVGPRFRDTIGSRV